MTLVPPSSKYGNASIVLGASATGWAHTGDTVETLIASVAIPANTIGLGQLEIVSVWGYPNNANNKELIVRLGTANDLTGTRFYDQTLTTTASTRAYTLIANRSTSAQRSFVNSNPSFGQSSGAITAGAIDTTQGTYVVFSCVCGNAADTITLESYFVRLIPGV